MGYPPVASAAGGITLILAMRLLLAVWNQRYKVIDGIANYMKGISQEVRTAALHSIICAVVLVIAALSDWPYFMYVLLRVFICCSSVYLAVKLYSRRRVPLAWLLGAVGVLFNPILPVRMAHSDWETMNAIIAVVFLTICAFLVWESLFRRRAREVRNGAKAVLAAGQLCDEMNGIETRILELAPTDSSLSNFFVVTSAADQRHALVIADVVKRRLLSDCDLIPTLDGINSGWLLLDYTDFVVHIFIAEMRTFYDVERNRKNAISFTPEEYEKVVLKA